MAAQVEAGGTLVRMAAQAWMWEAWMREAAASERRRLCGTLGTRARRRLVWLGASRLTRALEGGRRTCSLRAVSVATNCMRYLFIARFTPDTATTLQTGGGVQKRNTTGCTARHGAGGDAGLRWERHCPTAQCPTMKHPRHAERLAHGQSRSAAVPSALAGATFTAAAGASGTAHACSRPGASPNSQPAPPPRPHANAHPSAASSHTVAAR